MSELQALTGGAYQARSLLASAQRQLNLYSEAVPAPEGEPALVILYPTPGLRILTTLPQGPVRGIKQTTSGAVYVVAGSGVYLMSAAWSATLLGSITPGLTTPVSMADNGLSLVIVDGTASGWTVTLNSNVFAPIADPTGIFVGADRVDYLDTFFLFNIPNTPQFLASLSESVTFDPTYTASKTAFSDLLVSVVVARREIWLLGDRTTETWYDSGAATFPFESMQGAFVDHGCAAKYSALEVDNSVFWLSRDRQGQGIVLQSEGYNAKRVSNFAIEDAFSKYSTIADAVAWSYQMQGHTFYVLTFPTADKTWAYDLSNGLWNELAWIDSNGLEHRHRGLCAAFVAGVVAVGDWQSGNLYALDPSVFDDFGGPIKRVRAFPHMVASGKRVVYRSFHADFETGRSS